MCKYIIKRILLMIISIIAVFAVLFLLMYTSQVLIWVRPKQTFAEALGHAMHALGPYFKSVFFHWDLGTNFDGRSVTELVNKKLPITMKYNLAAFVVYFLGGIFLGLLAALHKNKLTDRIISGLSMIFNAMPTFIVIFFLVLYVGYKWKLLPPQEPFYTAVVSEKLKGLIIPIIALSLLPIGKFAQIIRGEVLENFSSEHYLLLRTKGLTKRQALFRHTLRESIVALLPQVVPTFVVVLSMSFFVEHFYNIQGLSNLFFHSMIVPTDMYSYVVIDIPVVVSISTILVAIIMVFSLVTDIIIGFVDPRVHVHNSKKTYITN